MSDDGAQHSSPSHEQTAKVDTAAKDAVRGDYDKQQQTTDRTIMWFTVVSGVGALISAGVAAYTATQLKGSSEQIDRAISNMASIAAGENGQISAIGNETDAIKDQSDTMRGQLDQMKSQTGSLAQQAKEGQISAGALQAQATAAQNISAVSAKAFEEENRPIIYIKLEPVASTDAFAFNTQIFNGGNRPAFLEVASVNVFFDPKKDVYPLDQPQGIGQNCMIWGETAIAVDSGIGSACKIKQSPDQVRGLFDYSRRAIVAVSYTYHAANGVRWQGGKTFFFQSGTAIKSAPFFQPLLDGPMSSFDRRITGPLFAPDPAQPKKRAR